MGTNPGGSSVARGLRALRSRARTLLVLRGLAAVVACVLLALVVVGLIDYALRTPWGFRAGVLVALVAGLGLAFRRFVLPAARFNPPLHEIALRVERSDAGRKAGLDGILASGLEFSERPGATPLERALAADVARKGEGLWTRSLVGAVLTPRQALMAGAGLLAAVAIAVGPAFVRPDLVSIAASRVLAPWAGAAWPTRTEIVDATRTTIHPAGEVLAIRGVLTRSHRKPGQTRVVANYRVLREGQDAGEVQTVVLTSQKRLESVDQESGEPVEGELFERLLEPGSLGLGGTRDEEITLEYWLETEDSATARASVLVVTPPALVKATARVEPPAYAREALAAIEPERAGATHQLAPVVSGTSPMPTPLVGSRVTVAIEHSKDVMIEGEGAAREAALARALGVERVPDGMEATLEPRRWTLSWMLSGPTTFRVRAADRHGLSSPDEAVMTIDAVSDAPPTAAVTEPAADEAVLATAVVPVTGEGRDDIEVASARVEMTIARAPGASTGAGAEPAGAATDLAAPVTPDAPARAVASSATLDLAKLELQPGNEVWLVAAAKDRFSLEGATHEEARSTPRRLRIISEPELLEELRAELQSVRQAAMRLDAEQAELLRAVGTEPPPRDLAERQAALGERIATQRQTLERLAGRSARNNLQDNALDGLLSDARSMVADAAGASQRAAQSIQNASRQGEDETPSLSDEERQEIAEAQEQVRDELGQLVQLLDNGQDAWVARRSVERLLAEQRRLLQQTSDLAGRTTGRSVGELTPDERSELDRIAERQSEAARQAADALDELSERSRELRDMDAAQAQAMAVASQRGRNSNVASTLEEAAQQVSQNQTNAATERQREAIETLEEMLEDLDSAEQRRDEALRRQLSSIIESLDGLIEQQDVQISLLTRAIGGASPAGLDQGMLRLNQNTLGVLDQITSAGREMERVGNLTLAAATAQSEAIVALREPVDLERAGTTERLSASRLREAKAEAERLEKEAAERDNSRKRRELRQAYREALERQTDLLGRATPLMGRELDRRDRAAVRQAGEQQEALRVTLEELRTKTEELADAQVFSFAHDRIDASMSAAAGSMREAKVDRAVVRNQEGAARLLQSLLAALQDPKNERDFRDQESGGGSGGGQGQGGQQLIPDLAKLRLLREMQQYVLEATRVASDDPGSTTPEDVAALGDLQRALSEQGRELMEQMAQPERALPGTSGPAQFLTQGGTP